MMANWTVLSIISILLGFGGLISVIILYTTTGGFVPYYYGIVLDAGSSHTQLTLYRWLGDKNRCTGVVEQVKTLDIGGGIVSYNDSEHVGQYLLPKVLQLSQSISKDRQSSSTIYLGATGGLRILNFTNPDKVNKIINSINKTFVTKAGSLKTKSVAVISGQDEGIFSWITTNYLLNTLKVNNFKEDSNESTYGVLDMGGSSAQIAYRLINTNKNNNTQHAPSVENENVQVRLYGINHTIKAGSNLCFGNDQARLRYWQLLIIKSEDKQQIKDPCFHKYGNNQIDGRLFKDQECIRRKDGQQIDSSHNYTLVGQGDLDLCRNIIDQILNVENCQASYYHCFNTSASSPPDQMKFYALSTYYYSAQALELTDKKISLPEFERKMKHFCSQNFSYALSYLSEENQEYAEKYCFQLHYIYGTLKNIYKFTNKTWENLNFAMNISGTQLGWSLGFMINATNAIPSEKPTDPVVTKEQFIAIAVICALIFLFSIYFIYKWRSSKEDDKDRYEPINIRT